MSSTIPDTAQQPGTTNPPEAAKSAQTPAPPPTPEPQPAPRASTDVEYMVFEEARTDTYTKLGTQRAKTAELAIETLVGEQKLKTAQGRFMAVPTRYITEKKPKVTTVTSIDWD